MRLLPAGLDKPTDNEDGLWVEHPGWPWYEGSWIHPPPGGQAVPEFEFEEGHDHNRNKAPPVLVIGSGNDSHIRQVDSRVPRRLCQVMKLGRNWWLEVLSAVQSVYCGDKELRVGDRALLQNDDTFSLLRPPTPLTYRILINDDDNWYIDMGSPKEFPNKHRSIMPYRQAHSPECPEELKRLAWQTDTMRKRSEEDQIRVADWAAFSQYVKRNYLRYGIECKPWVDAKRPHDEKPPSYLPRSYPDWIADIVAKERPLAGVSAERTLPFARCLELSGRKVAPGPAYRSGPPRLEELYSNPVAVGPAVARNLGKGAAPDEEPGTPGSRKGQGKGKADPLTAQRQAKADEAKRMPFRVWLETLDESRFLCQYHDQIAENFDSLEQIVDIYFKNGEIQKSFFEDAGIKKLGHRRIFEKWFSETFGPGVGAS